jgi:hypothetical protein
MIAERTTVSPTIEDLQNLNAQVDIRIMMPPKNAKDPYTQMDLCLMPALNNAKAQQQHRQHAQQEPPDPTPTDDAQEQRQDRCSAPTQPPPLCVRKNQDSEGLRKQVSFLHKCNPTKFFTLGSPPHLLLHP